MASGNSVARLGTYTTTSTPGTDTAGFTLEDDISPTVTGPVTTADGGITIYGPSVSGTHTGTAGDLTLAANITAGGTASSILIDSAGGIIQLGGTVTAGDNLTLEAGNGIIQSATGTVGTLVLPSVLIAQAGNLSLDAAGGAATVSNGITASGIAFAGTLSATSTQTAAGTVSVVASAGDIVEQPTGQLLATSLTGTSSSGNGFAGQSTFDVASGNTVTNLGTYATISSPGTSTAGFTLEDDISPDITGPLTIDGSLDIHGPNGAGTGAGQPSPTPDLILDANITTAGSALFNSAVGIVQLGGKLEATAGDITLTAGNGIIQLAGDATGTSTIMADAGNLFLTATGGTTTTSSGVTASGIAFAGTLSATSTQTAAGTVSVVASAGDIVEQPTGQLLATSLTGTSSSGNGFAGQSTFDVASGNTVTNLGTYATISAPGTGTAGFTLEDDISPTVTGPVTTADGSITIYGPSVSGTHTGTAGDLTLAANITAGGTASSILIDSAGGIIQLGGTVTAGDNLTLDAGNGIIQAATGTVGTLVLSFGADRAGGEPLARRRRRGSDRIERHHRQRHRLRRHAIGRQHAGWAGHPVAHCRRRRHHRTIHRPVVRYGSDRHGDGGQRRGGTGHSRRDGRQQRRHPGGFHHQRRLHPRG